MMPKPTSAQIERVRKAFESTKTASRPKGSVSAAARKVNMPRQTVARWLNIETTAVNGDEFTKEALHNELVGLLRIHGADMQWHEYKKVAKHPGSLLKYWSSWAEARLEAAKAAGVVPMDSRSRMRYEDRVAELQKQLRAAYRELNATEDVRSGVFKLAEQPIVPPDWVLKSKPSESKPGIPILFASDFQWGEVIKASELDGINAFNQNIARERYRRLIERTIDLCHSHMVNPDYPGIIYCRGGDMISGDIHQELRETNDLQSIPAVLDLVSQEVAGIKALADKFRRVHVISVPGNHGRTTMKPAAKGWVQTNYDYLSALMIERELREDPRISFLTPESGDARFAVYGYWFLLTHGDRIGSSGGQGFIGPAATITRGMKKLMDYYTTLGQHVDWLLLGHFHTSLELEYGWANGSLPGYSEYAKQFRMRPSPPSQWLLFVHPRYGVTCRWPILLGQRPKIWANAPTIHLEREAA